MNREQTESLLVDRGEEGEDAEGGSCQAVVQHRAAIPSAGSIENRRGVWRDVQALASGSIPGYALNCRMDSRSCRYVVKSSGA